MANPTLRADDKIVVITGGSKGLGSRDGARLRQ
jgi:NAD(P)-dependent dehydrogenase (short-subunit alcohol dehydrogenase family)